MAQFETFHPYQFVKVAVSPTKTEIGCVVSVTPTHAVVSTRHGFDVTVALPQLQRAFLLILDLNGVLCSRKKSGSYKPRPHVQAFLKFALANFVVAVWTSAEEHNGRGIITALFGDDADRLLFTWFRAQCTPHRTRDKPFGTRKDLQRVFDRWPQSFHAGNTIIVDDSVEKCTHPDLALVPRVFDYRSNGEIDEADDGLLPITESLREVLATDSLRPVVEAAARRVAAQLAEEEEQRKAAAAATAAAAAAAAAAGSGGSAGSGVGVDVASLMLRARAYTEEAIAAADAAAPASGGGGGAGSGGSGDSSDSGESGDEVGGAAPQGGKAKKRRGGKRAQKKKAAAAAAVADAMAGTSVPSLPAAAPPVKRDRSAAAAEQGAARGPPCCYYWLGSCTFGPGCRFAHVPDDGVTPCQHRERCRGGHKDRVVAQK